MASAFTRESVDKLMEVLSGILSEKYGCKVTIRAVHREDQSAQQEMSAEAEKVEVPEPPVLIAS